MIGFARYAADLSAADWLDVEYMIVVNQDGTQHHYVRVGGAMMPLAPVHNPAYVAESDPVETLAADVAYWFQTWSEIGNPPEMVMRQGEAAEEEYTINMDSRLVKDFFFDPATIVFLDDVANEYGVEDPEFFSAMVYTIIYRELQDPLGVGLPNADNPSFQGRWDTFKQLLNAIPYLFQRPMTFRGKAITLIGQLDGDPSLGIGALSMEAVRNIQSGAEESGIDIYLPLLAFDNPSTLDHVPFSQGEHLRDGDFFPGTWNPQVRTIRAIPPSNQEYGAWRVELPRFEHRSQSGLQQGYEPTLGYIAAEVAIAMRSTQYRNIKGEDKKEVEERQIAFLIGNHAYRSVVPPMNLYDPDHFSEDTHQEIRWARDFKELMDERRTEIQNVAQNE